MQVDVVTTSASQEGRGSNPSALRTVVVTAAVTSGLIVVAGIAMVAYPWVSFHRFNLEDLIPKVAGLAILRGWGPWGAAVTASFFVTAIEHNRALSRGAPARNEVANKRGVRAILDSRVGLAAMFAAFVPLLYTPVSALALGSSMVTAKVCLGLRPSTFFAFVDARDVLRGIFLAVLFGCLPAGWSLLGTRLARAPHRGIAFKLLMTWLAMLGVSFVGRLVLGLVGDGE